MFYETPDFVPERGNHEDAPPDRAARTDGALFLDFDGTLVEFADTPDGVRAPEGFGRRLSALRARMNGALCIVTGRAVAAIDRHLPGYDGDVIAAHGVERRINGVEERHPLAGSDAVARLQERVSSFAARDPAFLVETKPAGVVLHYRRKPDLHSEAHRFMDSIRGDFPDFALQPAKMAVEMKPADVGKVVALKWLMARPPYAGRRPYYFGDDATDEPAMEWVVTAGGCAVKVGPGESCANHRMASVGEVHAALEHWIETNSDEPCPTV